MTFIFEDEFDCIDEVLQEVKSTIFRISQDYLDLVQPDWTTQLSHMLECYNVIAKEEDKDPQKINIPETEGHNKVEGKQIENPDVTVPLKMKQVNIGMEVEPKFVKIGDYWDDAMVNKVVKLLRKYQDLFPTNFMELKGIIGDLGIMKITLKPDTKPVKQRPCRLNLKYKEKVHLELDKMLTTGIIEPIEESDWVSPMVVQEKKHKHEIRICIDLRKLNDACVHDPFLTPFTDEVLDNVGGQEVYSFTDGFSGYHQIKIALEDRSKMTFATEWEFFQYTVMPFGLKNAPAIISRTVIAAFKEFIHNFLEVYFDDWTMFGLVKFHVASLPLMLDTCQRYKIALNLKKCLVYVPFGTLMGHVVCRQGLMVDLVKIAVILNLEVSRSVKQLCTTLGHTGYYRKFIKGYAPITAPMEKLLKKDAAFYWNEDCQKCLDVLKGKMVTADMEKLLKKDVIFCQNEDCQKILDVLKGKMVTTPILVFPNWKKEFHVHVDASCIALREVLTQVGGGELDHPIAFASRRLSKAEQNYSTNECEGLAMVYALQKFRHYKLGGHFKMYIDHSVLKYLVNSVGGRICRWLLLFQEYDFEVIMKPR